jgi:hypothetical protein
MPVSNHPIQNAPSPAHAYLWPSPELDALESVRFELDQGLIARFVTPCDSFIKVQGTGHTGRFNVADWIRTVRRIPLSGECDNLTTAGVQRYDDAQRGRRHGRNGRVNSVFRRASTP